MDSSGNSQYPPWVLPPISPLYLPTLEGSQLGSEKEKVVFPIRMGMLG